MLQRCGFWEQANIILNNVYVGASEINQKKQKRKVLDAEDVRLPGRARTVPALSPATHATAMGKSSPRQSVFIYVDDL